jgi:hypothetical protein
MKYKYKSACCEHEYLEIRQENEPLFYPICNKCGIGDYQLISETPEE